MTCEDNIQLSDSNNIDIMCPVTGAEIRKMITVLTVTPKVMELKALYISGNHRVNDHESMYGCVIKFPDGNSIYLTEETFKKLFNIIEEED